MNDHSELGSTVLLIVSEPVLCRGICRALDEAGLRVVEVESPDKAWIALESTPDVQVVLADFDARMETSGLELAHKLHKRWPAVKLVLTLGRMRHLSPREVPENGCFLPRPLRVDILLSEITRATS